MKMRALPLCLTLSLIPCASHAADLQHLDEQALDARLNYLENRLSELHKPATYWQYGWTGFYGVTAAAQLYMAADEDDSDDSTRLWVNGTKAFLGLTQMLLKPHPVVSGLDQLRTMPINDRGQKLARLQEAEQLMQQSVWRADERYTLKPHLITVGVNLLGAAAIAAWGDSDDAFGSAALGIAIGEAVIWTQPTTAQQYWNSYQQQFNGAPDSALRWRIVPGINSVALQIQF